MSRSEEVITGRDFVSEIVNRHYCTADVFRKYGIDYCCGAKWSIEDTCFGKHLDAKVVVQDLNQSLRAGTLSLFNCQSWSTDFQVDFIRNVYHSYLTTALPDIQSLTKNFTDKHEKKFPALQELNSLLKKLSANMQQWIPLKENSVFPYAKRISHAYDSKESYASLMVRTLQKPFASLIPDSYDKTLLLIKEIQSLTHNYMAPANACTSHKITFYKLQQLCQHLQQQLYLEYEVLYPKVLLMEKEMLAPAANSGSE